MLLTTQQSYDLLLEKHGAFAREICDKCGAVLGAVRFTRENESGVWCGGECRGGGERQKIHKGGRPRKYKNERTRKHAHAQQQRDSRLRSSVTKTCQQPNEGKGLTGAKTLLSTIPLTTVFPVVETACNENAGARV
jgi:hypothetical protein